VPAPHPPEFRRRAVALAREGSKSTAVLAKELGISESCLRNWVHQADIDDAGDSGSNSKLTSDEKRELAQLRRDKKRLEMEVEILKRRRPTSPGRTSSQTDLPAGQRTH
jgi:transposase